MADLSLPVQDSVAAQRELFRRSESELGLSPLVLSKRTPIPYNTLRGWRDGTAMPAWALGALGEAGVPDELLSLITAPWRRSVMTDETGEGDFDTAAAEALDFATEHARSRHPKSPGGVAIVPQEAAILKIKVARTAAAARKAAA